MTKSRVALVTGAGSGMGWKIALRLARDGLDVAINNLPRSAYKLHLLKAEIEKIGRKAVIVIADVSDDLQVKNMVEETVERLGGLDVMVANAGTDTAGFLVNTTVQDWDNVFATNTRGVFLCYKYAAIQMIAQGRGGRILSAASFLAKQGQPCIGAYSATKSAVRGLTHSAAMELGRYGITVNAYSPGAIDTPMIHRGSDEFGGGDSIITSESAKTAIGRIGQPEEVAALVSYLASPGAAFVTGQTISANGGRHLD